MFIRSIHLDNFRNYGRLDLDVGPSVNIFYGNNAQGKTNLVEGIYVASSIASHRTSKDSDLIRFGENEYKVSLDLTDDDGSMTTLSSCYYTERSSLSKNGRSGRLLIRDNAPVEKISVVPWTSGALGFAQQLETHSSEMSIKTEMENRIATLCAGRAAEEIHFQEITTGASNDIEKATMIARAMVTRYGMTDDFDMVCLEKNQGGYLGGETAYACSDITASLVDQKVIEIVKTQHNSAKELLKKYEHKLDELAAYLYMHETITGEEFMSILLKE
jgi:hypothetical protein